MNGAHDMGGRAGFGPVAGEAHEPVFHAAWEAKVYGMASALGAHDLWNIDEDRHACENRSPAEYVAISYYEIWLRTLETLLVSKGIVTHAELSSGHSRNGRVTRPALLPHQVMAAQLAPASYHRESGTVAAFSIGQKLRARNHMTSGHTRLPAYLRGVVGSVIAIHGCHVFPDANASGAGELPDWLYAVQFSARDVWGNGSRDHICADLWEAYLEPA
jgi:nitrile hydratase subunit beta